MSDLISRSDLTNKIRGIVPGSQDVDFIVRLIDEQPTAYNPEKVVEEIKAQFGCKDCEYVDEFQHPACNECAELEVINDICDIVKRGGIYE